MIPVEKLAPYLAHGLQFIGGGAVYEMEALGADGRPDLSPVDGGVCRTPLASQVGVEYKPILLPITGVFTNGSHYEKGYKKEVPRMWGAAWCDSALHSFQEADYFFKHKFDVFGLIAEGLAVDESALTPNS